jgi:hypothetical protein
VIGKKFISVCAAGAVAALWLVASARAQSNPGHSSGKHIHEHGIQHVLLISIDGMHALDFANCAMGIAGINGGNPFCPNLAQLGQNGVNYLQTSTSKPSDSFPGLMALVTGGSPRTVGAFYDVNYDRALSPMAETTQNGIPGGACPGTVGTQLEYEEGIDFDKTALNGGAPSGDGGLNSINPNFLPRDPKNNCAPVYPHNFVRVNTIFGVAKAAGGYTAWSDKHPAYEAVNGPGDGKNVDDYFAPEVNSIPVNLPQVTLMKCDPLPDQIATTPSDDYSLKVQAILHEIDGKTHDGSSAAPVPAIFGMNFQAVSVGQKLVQQHSTASGFSVTGGYTDATGTPSASLLQEIEFADNSIGLMVAELKSQGLYDSTLIIISAKHGQSPIDPVHILRITGDTKSTNPNAAAPSDILGGIGNGTVLQADEDDISLLWLNDESQSGVSSAVSKLETNAKNAGFDGGEIFYGPPLDLMFNDPSVDSRTPDIIITPNA